MHIIFDPDSVDWENFFAIQQGSGFYFEGVPYQRGYGVGAIFANLVRFLLPIAKTVGSAIGSEGINMGRRVLNNMHEGESLKQSLKKESREGLKNVVDRVYAQKGNGKRIRGTINMRGRLSKKGPKKLDYLGNF